MTGPARTANPVSRSRNQKRNQGRVRQTPQTADTAPLLACFDRRGCWPLRPAHARHCGTNGRRHMFLREPASPRIGLRRTTRRGCPAPDTRLPLETCRVALGLWSCSVCGEKASSLCNQLEGFAEACRGMQRGCTAPSEGSAAQGSGFRGIESSTAIPLCQPERKFGIAKLPSQNVLDGRIEWPRARGAETGRRTRPSAGRVRTEHVHASRERHDEMDVQRSIISWIGKSK